MWHLIGALLVSAEQSLNNGTDVTWMGYNLGKDCSVFSTTKTSQRINIERT